MFSISFTKHRNENLKEHHLLTLIIKMQIILFAPSLPQQHAPSSVSPLSYTNMIFNQSARVLS